jgi:cytochrome P450
LLLRHCEQPYVVARGTSREALIAQGSLVVLGTESAMFDEDRFPDPSVFRLDRPAENYIHFGHGLHACFGSHMARILIPAVAKQLLRMPGLRRADGGDGRIRFDGAFPDRLVVEFDAP